MREHIRTLVEESAPGEGNGLELYREDGQLVVCDYNACQPVEDGDDLEALTAQWLEAIS